MVWFKDHVYIPSSSECTSPHAGKSNKITVIHFKHEVYVRASHTDK